MTSSAESIRLPTGLPKGSLLLTAAMRRWEIPLLAGCWLLGYWAPWSLPGSSNVWLLLASWAATHGLGDLAKSSALVTAALAGVAVLGAALRLFPAIRPLTKRMVAQSGLMLTCVPLCALLPGSGATLFLLAVLAATLAGERSKGAAMRGEQAAQGLWERLFEESFPVFSAICFATMSWQYNAQWLLRGLLVSAGTALLLRAALPSGPQI